MTIARDIFFSRVDARANVKHVEMAIEEAFAISPTLRHASPGTQAAVFEYLLREGGHAYENSFFREYIEQGDLAAAKRYCGAESELIGT